MFIYKVGPGRKPVIFVGWNNSIIAVKQPQLLTTTDIPALKKNTQKHKEVGCTQMHRQDHLLLQNVCDGFGAMSQTPRQQVLDEIDFLSLWVTSGNYLNGSWFLDVNWSMFFNIPYIPYTACQTNMAALGNPNCFVCTAAMVEWWTFWPAKLWYSAEFLSS